MLIPNHIGIIMDGNGRWAEQRGKSRSAGHKEGAANLKRLLIHMYDRGVRFVSLYAFSTENFKRTKEEVGFLMNLFIKMFEEELDFVQEKGVKMVFSSRRENIPDKLFEVMEKTKENTKDNKNGTLNICLNYGGQYEIVDMVKKVSEKVKNNEVDIENIDTNLIEENLYVDLPPLDYVIRTSGEQRTSNFMIYQSAYAEYYFPETLFPDFNEEEFDKAIIEYNKRNRRFGGN